MNQTDYNRLVAALRKMPTRMLRLAGAEARAYFLGAFEKQAWDGTNWAARRPEQPNGNKRPSNKQRNLLVKTGTLRRSVRVIAMPGEVRVGTDVPYAKIHNEGGTINHPGGTPYIFTGKKGKVRRVFIRATTAARRESNGDYVKRTEPHGITIPARPFIRNSPILNAQIGNVLEADLKATIKPFEQ